MPIIPQAKAVTKGFLRQIKLIKHHIKIETVSIWRIPKVIGLSIIVVTIVIKIEQTASSIARLRLFLEKEQEIPQTAQNIITTIGSTIRRKSSSKK